MTAAVWLACLLLLVAAPAQGQAESPPPAPDAAREVAPLEARSGYSRLAGPLVPWVDWVAYDLPELSCTQVDGGRQCAWPGQLALEVDDTGASFRLEVWRDTAGTVELPGSRAHWPQDVRVARATPGISATRLPVVGEDVPAAKLPAGHHTVTGRLVWTRIPEFVAVPAHAGIVRLEVNGQSLPYPRIDRSGQLWLKEGSQGVQHEADALRVAVYRLVQDGVPIRVTTRLELNVSGRAREADLGAALLAGSRPITVRSELPVKIAPDGHVRVYVRPGTHFVDLEAVLPAAGLASLNVPQHPEGAGFENQEVWVFKPDETLRSLQLEGLLAVDPERTTLPGEWRAMATYMAEPGQTLSWTEQRRGQTETAPNALHLHREIWMDIDGGGATSRDTLSGVLYQGWRLDYGKQGQLGRASQAGSSLLITQGADSGPQGVEVRQSELELVSDVRLAPWPQKFRAVGWAHDVTQLSATLHLPPGWLMLGGKGVDEISGSWLGSWTLLDFFYVLIVALAAARLLGWPWGAIALLALVLAHGQEDTPRWLWIQMLASLALLRVLRDGWLRRLILLYRYAVVVAVFVILAVFGRDQLQQAPHPQTANSWAIPSSSPVPWEGAEEKAHLDALEQEAVPAAPAMDLATSGADGGGGIVARKSSVSDESYDRPKKGGQAQALQQLDPNAVVQTGPGVPQWVWQSVTLRWNGPVHRDHEVELWYLSSWQHGILMALRFVLLLVMALALVDRKSLRWTPEDEAGDAGNADMSGERGASGRAGGMAAPGLSHLALALALGLAATVGVREASAQPIPDATMLQNLRARLEAAHQCQGPCVVVARADLEIDDVELVMRADVSSQQTAAWPLPGPSDALHITSVRLNGEPTHQLRRNAQGVVAVRLPPGAHQIEVRARLASRNALTLQFDASTRPRLMTFSSQQWSLEGLGPEGVPDSSVQLTRLAQPEGLAPQPEVAEFELPAWFQVERHFALGLPWQVRTTIRRPDSSRPHRLRLPLLAGEAVITEGVRVEDGHAVLEIARGVEQVEFASELGVAPQVALTAPSDTPWTETWQVECSPIWRCDLEGIAPTLTVQDGSFRPVWHPWPGESVRVAVTRPQGAKGQAVTVEKASYKVAPGQRLLQGTLELVIQASQGASQTVTLPAGAQLQHVLRDGQQTSIRAQEHVVRLPLQPGTQTFIVSWQQPWERTVREDMPVVRLGSAAVNATLSMELGDRRWLIWASGPPWGPAVLFWSDLIIVLIVAGLLGAMRSSPLRTHEWALLGIGMVQMPFVVALPVIAWFFAMRWRQQRGALDTAAIFNLSQLGLVALTVAAMACLYGAIHTNLLLDVDMQVLGADSHNTLLNWYVDRVGEQLPEATLYSLPIWYWRGAMLAWALWLAWKLLGWLPWAWNGFSSGGLWQAGQPLPVHMPPYPRSPASEPAPAPTEPQARGSEGAPHRHQPPAAAQAQERDQPLSPPHTAGEEAPELTSLPGVDGALRAVGDSDEVEFLLAEDEGGPTMRDVPSSGEWPKASEAAATDAPGTVDGDVLTSGGLPQGGAHDVQDPGEHDAGDGNTRDRT